MFSKMKITSRRKATFKLDEPMTEENSYIFMEGLLWCPMFRGFVMETRGVTYGMDRGYMEEMKQKKFQYLPLGDKVIWHMTMGCTTYVLNWKVNASSMRIEASEDVEERSFQLVRSIMESAMSTDSEIPE